MKAWSAATTALDAQLRRQELADLLPFLQSLR
jgi:hypothetical protein